MQYLSIAKSDTLLAISKIVGPQNVEALLAENSLTRTPKVGQQYYERCAQVISEVKEDVTPSRKAALLNGLTGSDEVFEKACLMDEDEWKLFSVTQSFRDTLRVPESIVLPYSNKVIGTTIGTVEEVAIGNGTLNRAIIQRPVESSVNNIAYRAVIQNLKITGKIDPSIFNTVNASAPVAISGAPVENKAIKHSYNLPWGKIQIYSSLLDELMDIPAYPEPLETGRSASYTSMPEIIYQYEPWIVYESSGPREQRLQFHLHRDMWTGNHLDGRANALVRFCEANTFPRYTGSTVESPTVRIYIDGKTFVNGVLISTNTSWDGPLGLDNWFLEFTLDLAIQEVSLTPLNIDKVRKFGIIGT